MSSWCWTRPAAWTGEKLLQAKDAAAYVLDHLGVDDRFDIVSFSSANAAVPHHG